MTRNNILISRRNKGKPYSGLNNIKIETHMHTEYSKDCLMHIDDIRAVCLKKNIIPCITDHNTIKGALAYRKTYGKNSCIIGEEIMTSQGEIIGLYLKSEIPAGLGVIKTLELLRRQGAIIIIPHPFDRMRQRSALKYDIKKLKKYNPIIEVFNSRTIFMDDNIAAERFARRQGLRMIVGSDAHTLPEIGRSFIETEYFDIKSKKAFLEIFNNASMLFFYTKKSSVFVHIKTKIVKRFGLNRRWLRK
jgi:predicted metal-dependent phosphoesterase TrpH